MDYLPLYLDVRDTLCLVVGGDSVALRKIRLLLSAGARIRLVAPDILEELSGMLDHQRHEIIQRPFQGDDLDGVRLVIAATDSDTVNGAVADAAKARGLTVNVVDGAEQGNAIMPAIIDRSPLIVSVSSAGKAPVLARLLRTRLESLLPDGYGRLADLAGSFRAQVKARFSSLNDRRYFWEKVFGGPAAEQALAGNMEQARRMIGQALEALEAQEEQLVGEVYLVGGGPGDPDLLTFRALRLMQQADVVLHDRLVSEDVLALCRRDADYIYVGKRRDQHTLPQEDINTLLVKLAKEGKRVLRLKGGDPFIFGRGGEEIDTLADEGIPFQVVPGITAASGCASYAGIPLTHRDYAQSVRFVTGHLKDGGYDLNWSEMVRNDQTLVFYMGLMGLPRICQELIDHGRNPETPVALIQQGTTREQRVYTGSLTSIVSDIAEIKIKPPTLIIVGEVVQLHERLKWFGLEEEYA
ncbi:siroheme synthase CysG [Kistimonas asteriae]|uniref:siroheme synthase CysG n=1 Tax=Kistimonas asteriae TaxID=517724 RepID=UPI001BAC2297